MATGWMDKAMAEAAPTAAAAGVAPPAAAAAAERSSGAPSFWRTYRVAIWSVVVLALFVAGWEWGFRALGVPKYFIPTLSEIWAEFLRAYELQQLVRHTAITLYSVVAGFALGSLFGMWIGYLLGMSPTAEIVLSPYILALQIAPKVAFAPLFILWFGYTIFPKILVAILIVFFPVLINVLSAVRAVDPAMINLARTFNATRWQIFRKIEFPASMGSLFAGLRIGSTLAVIGVTVGELVGGNRGLGFLLVTGEGQGNAALVFLTIILLTLIGIIAYCAVILVERRVLHYMPRREFGDFDAKGGK
jgi:NitT/TauT family transport system permease protein